MPPGWVAGALASRTHVVVLVRGANDGLRRDDVGSMTAALDVVIGQAQGAVGEVVRAGMEGRMEGPVAHGAA